MADDPSSAKSCQTNEKENLKILSVVAAVGTFESDFRSCHKAICHGGSVEVLCLQRRFACDATAWGGHSASWVVATTNGEANISMT